MNRMNYRATCLVLLALSSTLRAEQVWVGTLETDSLRSLHLSVNAFTQAASLPGTADEQTSLLQSFFSLPSLDCVESGEPVRVFWVADSTHPLGTQGNPAPVSILPLKRDIRPLDFYLFKAYKSKRSLMGVTTYSMPVSTNSPACVVIHETARTLTIAPTRAVLLWLQSQQALLSAYRPRQTSETLRVNLNPRILSELLPLQTLNNIYALVAQSCDYIGLGLTPEGRGCTVTLHVQPKATSELEALLNDMPSPKPEIWNAIPENALFSTLYMDPGKTNWSTYLNQSSTNAFATIFAGLQPFLGKERLLYLVPTRGREGMSFVQIAPVTNERATREAIKRLSTRENKIGFRLKFERTRSTPDQTFERYSLSYQPAVQVSNTNAPTETASVSLATVMPLFLRNAILEVTVTQGYLFAVASSASAIENECPDYPFPIQRLTLNQRLSSFTTSTNLIVAGEVCLHSFLRQLITMLVSTNLRSKALFSSVTDGFQFWLTREADNSSALSIRLSANEIAALQKAFREDREALQDIFFTLFTNQIKPVNEAPKQQP